jgi:transposase
MFWLNEPDALIRDNTRHYWSVIMGQKRSYKQYSKEFKEEAVALIRDQGYSVAEASKSLGVASNMLYRWKDQQEQLSAGTALAEDERAELQRLRKENKELRMEKEILKKASAFFAKEMK